MSGARQSPTIVHVLHKHNIVALTRHGVSGVRTGGRTWPEACAAASRSPAGDGPGPRGDPDSPRAGRFREAVRLA
jgi:hypothetical protein